MNVAVRARRTLAGRSKQIGAAVAIAPLRAVLRLLALLSRRDPALWVFGSWHGRRYADNSRALFDRMSREHPEIRVVWLSRDQSIVDDVRALGLEAHALRSRTGLRLALRAAVHVVDCGIEDLDPATLGRAHLVNLWHGVPLKRLQPFDWWRPDLRWRAAAAAKRLLVGNTSFSRADVLLCANGVMAERMAAAFGIDDARIVRGGLPRNQGLINRACRVLLTADERRLNDEMESLATQGTTRILYAPTFRDDDLTTGAMAYLEGGGLEQVLDTHDAVLYVKSHSAVVGVRTSPTGSRIRELGGDVDLHPVLDQFDVLITDYSSIYIDFLVLDRPLIFFPHDLDSYGTVVRGFYDSYDHVTPGPKVFNSSQLGDAIAAALSAPESHQATWSGARRAVRDRYLNEDGSLLAAPGPETLAPGMP